ncbi:FAD-dependent thymidylate synthase [Deinococcus kurensis]|uniref:FAD-dependent thymidylate synthase n=1 Tax=Deinococcus kurensis TaxID=2662757 RepID=UPI0012D2AFC8|nr:FAD-dependent thymidylate synthase [Deinococcus kurensis]
MELSRLPASMQPEEVIQNRRKPERIITVNEAGEVQYDTVQVLNLGYVTQVAMMGTETDIVTAARVSYQEGTKQVLGKRGLIDRLLREEHMSPFEMPMLRYQVRMPDFVRSHYVRHRTATLNSESGRYSVMRDLFFLPDTVRVQDAHDRQMSAGVQDDPESAQALALLTAHTRRSYEVYQELLALGMPREQARWALPNTLYVHLIWQQNLRNLLHLFRLRMDRHAQTETRLYAWAMYDLTVPHFPLTLDSWENHVLYARRFSFDELEILQEGMAQLTALMSERGMGDVTVQGVFKELASTRLKGTRLRNFTEKLSW